MKNHKAPGPDIISPEVFKADRSEIISFLHILFNTVWQKENPPSEWSKMIVIPVNKKGSKIDPSNYHTISVFSIPGTKF